MPDQKSLEQIVAQMEAAGESPESIAAVVQEASKSTATPTTFMSDADWAKLSVKDKLQNVLAFAGNAIGPIVGMPGFGTQAKEHPVRTSAMVFGPAAAGLAAPALAPIAPKLAEALPTVASTATGAYEGYKYNGLPGALMGGVGGFYLGNRAGRTASSALERIMGTNKSLPVPGARVVPGSPSEPFLPPDELKATLESMMKPSGARTLPSTHPSGGGYTTPTVTTPANAGGTLAPGTPSPSLEQTLREGLESTLKQPSGVTVGRTFPPGGGYTLPTTQPAVTMSPRAKEVLAAMSKPKAATPSPISGEQTFEELYRELARSPILTPEKQKLFEFLDSVIKTRSSQIGESYAAGGKP